MSWKLSSVWETYKIDEGNMGYYCGHIGWFRTEAEALECRKEMSFYEVHEVPVLEVDGKIFRLYSKENSEIRMK